MKYHNLIRGKQQFKYSFCESFNGNRIVTRTYEFANCAFKQKLKYVLNLAKGLKCNYRNATDMYVLYKLLAQILIWGLCKGFTHIASISRYWYQSQLFKEQFKHKVN